MIANRWSPLHDALHNAQHEPRAAWGQFCGMPVPLQLGESGQERAQAQVLGLADVSCFPRVVVKGPQAAAFLEAQGIAIPTEILSVSTFETGGIIVRTGGSEFFVEDRSGEGAVARVEAALGSSQPGVYRVLRQDAAIVLSGSRAGELLRHVSSYDFLAQESQRHIVLTQIAGVTCMALRCTLQAIPAFRLWTDGTFGIYIWHTLLEIAEELGGGTVGTAVFFPDLPSGPLTP